LSGGGQAGAGLLMQRFRSFAGRDKGHELAPFGFQLNILACKPLIKQIISMILIDSID
jgi:hypothetical protein